MTPGTGTPRNTSTPRTIPSSPRSSRARIGAGVMWMRWSWSCAEIGRGARGILQVEPVHAPRQDAQLPRSREGEIDAQLETAVRPSTASASDTTVPGRYPRWRTCVATWPSMRSVSGRNRSSPPTVVSAYRIWARQDGHRPDFQPQLAAHETSQHPRMEGERARRSWQRGGGKPAESGARVHARRGGAARRAHRVANAR